MPRWNQPGCPCCGSAICQYACPACGGIVLTGGTIRDSNGFESALIPTADVFGNQLLVSSLRITPGAYDAVYYVENWLGPPFPKCPYVPSKIFYRFTVSCSKGNGLVCSVSVPPTTYCEDWDGTKRCGYNELEIPNFLHYVQLFGATGNAACDQENGQLSIEFNFDVPFNCAGIREIPPPTASATATITYNSSKDYVCCYPCLIPKKDLTLSVWNGLFYEGHVLRYSDGSPALWLSDCITLGGTSFRFYARCGSNNQVEVGTVTYNGGLSPYDCADKKSPAYYAEDSTVRRASCSPYHIDFVNGWFLDE